MKAPNIPSFIKQNQHSTYSPRYRHYKPGDKSDVETSFRNTQARRRLNQKPKSSARTLVIIVLVLVALTLWFLNTDYFEKILTVFLNMK